MISTCFSPSEIEVMALCISNCPVSDCIPTESELSVACPGVCENLQPIFGTWPETCRTKSDGLPILCVR